MIFSATQTLWMILLPGRMDAFLGIISFNRIVAFDGNLRVVCIGACCDVDVCAQAGISGGSTSFRASALSPSSGRGR
jgi:hypothetical protein